MPRGGARPGAGRPKKKLNVVKRAIAEQVLAELPEKDLWKSLVADKATRFDSLKYLTERRDGKVPQGLDIGMTMTPGEGEEGPPLLVVNFVSSTLPGANKGRITITDKRGFTAVYEDGQCIELRPPNAPLIEGRYMERAAHEPVEEMRTAPVGEVLPPLALPSPSPDAERRRILNNYAKLGAALRG